MMPRDYKQERETAKKRGETGNGKASGDNVRHKARRKVIKASGPIPAGVDVDHKKPLRSGGSNSQSNLRKRASGANKAAGGRSGSRAGKAAGGRKSKK